MTFHLESFLKIILTHSNRMSGSSPLRQVFERKMLKLNRTHNAYNIVLSGGHDDNGYFSRMSTVKNITDE